MQPKKGGSMSDLTKENVTAAIDKLADLIEDDPYDWTLHDMLASNGANIVLGLDDLNQWIYSGLLLLREAFNIEDSFERARSRSAAWSEGFAVGQQMSNHEYMSIKDIARELSQGI
tara:strand:+ start:290 stop:637 length:348 start_codon:yes stop_codon:yes gene_type:complete